MEARDEVADMILARVKGSVVSTRKSERIAGMKLRVVEEVDTVTLEGTGRLVIAVDILGAAEGELVMCVSGSPARQTAATDNKPVDLVITGIVDYVEVHGKSTFRKQDDIGNQN
jgi:microcompartment protein CcmK/EutM